jgi:DMSO/TMAO reductase YedYZ molybdopterin-dependent catalytic subunit
MPGAFDSPNPKSLPVHGIPNLPDPQDWQLVIHSGDRAVTLDTQAVARFPHADLVDTFTCLAGWTAGPLRWRGVRLSTLLDGLGGQGKLEWSHGCRLSQLLAYPLASTRCDGGYEAEHRQRIDSKSVWRCERLTPVALPEH